MQISNRNVFFQKNIKRSSMFKVRHFIISWKTLAYIEFDWGNRSTVELVLILLIILTNSSCSQTKASHFSSLLYLPSPLSFLLFLHVLSCLVSNFGASLRIALKIKIMELVHWSLNALDRIFSMRSSGSGEPVCPDGTFAACYMRDSWEEWRVVCLAILSVEDIEDLYIFGTMITGYLLIGLGIALVYRKIRKPETAVRGPKLPNMIVAVGRAVGAQTVVINRNMENILEKLVALQRRMDRFCDQNGQTEWVVSIEMRLLLCCMRLPLLVLVFVCLCVCFFSACLLSGAPGGAKDGFPTQAVDCSLFCFYRCSSWLSGFSFYCCSVSSKKKKKRNVTTRPNPTIII